MIDFHFSITSPFPNPHAGDLQDDYFCKTWSLTKNKSFEIQVTRFDDDVAFMIDIDTRFVGHDHAGIEFSLEFFGFYLGLTFYDRRHWNYEEARWQTDAEAKAENDEWVTQTTETVEDLEDALDLEPGTIRKHFEGGGNYAQERSGPEDS